MSSDESDNVEEVNSTEEDEEEMDLAGSENSEGAEGAGGSGSGTDVEDDSMNEDQDEDDDQDRDQVPDGQKGVPSSLKMEGQIKQEKSSEKDKLKEAQSVYQSNLYRIQIKELLAEVAIKAKQLTQVEAWCRDFRTWVTTVKTLDGMPIEQLEKLKRKLKIKQLALPVRIHPTRDSNLGLFKWVPPSEITPVGSWGTNTANTAVSGMSAYDIVIEIPKECLNKSDYLNHKYHIKRALYLSYLGSQLQARGDVVQFCCADGNLLRPVLEVDLPSETGLAKPQIRLHFIPPAGLFKEKRFDIDTNNIRPNYFYHADQSEDEAVLSTPAYNQAILNDICMVRSHEITANILSTNTSNTKSICEAIKLLKIWLQQRHLNQGYGAFSNYIMTMFVCYLLQHDKVTETMSSYQILRVVFVHLTKSDWLTKGISLCSTEESIAQWFLQFDVVFLDASGLINLTSHMSKYTYQRVKREAQLGLDILNSSDVYGFQALFIRDVPFTLNFDHILQIKVTPRLTSQLENLEEHKPTALSASGYFVPIGIAAIGNLVETGLKNRIQALNFDILKPPSWSLSEELPPVFNGFMTLQLGMIINRAECFKVVEKCETEKESDLEAFRTFWGDKSQMRRFRDGTIVEAVSFEEERKEQPDSHVSLLMLQYILKKHLDLHISDEELTSKEGTPAGYYLSNQMDNIIDPTFRVMKPVKTNGEMEGPPSKKKKKKHQEEQPSERISVDDVTRQAIASLDGLSRLLRDLEGLPLTITSVQGTSSILRHTNICPTPPQAYFSSNLLTIRPSSSVCSLHIKESLLDEKKSKIPLYTEPIEVTVQLEGSGKWPDDLDAIRRLKCAFLVRIGQLLQSKFRLTVHLYPSKLQVIKDGFIFSIQLTYFRELVLLKQLQSDDGIIRYRDNLESLQREKSTLLLPKLSSILHSIHSQHSAFGKTCRLVKRWIASHMLLASKNLDVKQPDYCLTEEAVELIVSSLFLNYHPYMEPPNEAQVGFLRFLNFISTTDWKSTAIILNFNDTFTKEDISAIESEFRKKRSTLPTPFISYPDDRLNSVWTKNVLPIVWRRLVGLGKQALQLSMAYYSHNSCSSQIKTEEAASVDPFKTIFNPDLSQFDVLIWIKRNMNCKKRISLNEPHGVDESKPKQIQYCQYKEYAKPADEVIPIVNFDPVEAYLVELRQNFGHFGLFLHDTYGGHVIAFVWKPDAIKEHEFTISSVKGQILGRSATSSSPVVVPHIEGLTELFSVLGEGIVDRIETVKKYEPVKMESIETEP